MLIPNSFMMHTINIVRREFDNDSMFGDKMTEKVIKTDSNRVPFKVYVQKGTTRKKDTNGNYITCNGTVFSNVIMNVDTNDLIEFEGKRYKIISIFQEQDVFGKLKTTQQIELGEWV